jgi:tetratricopeptide (TPR) repeat protein
MSSLVSHFSFPIPMRSRMLEKQWALYDAGEYRRAYEQTRALLVRLPLAERPDAYRLLGLARYHADQYLEAVHWFREACEGSDVADDWCRLAMAAAMRGDLKLAAEAFEQVRFCHEASRYGQSPGLYVHLYWYASALSDAGQQAVVAPLLDELAQAYRRMRQTDTVFLLARGMPFLSSVLSLALQHFRIQESHAAGVAWLEALAKGLDEAGQRQVGLAMHDLVQKDGARREVPAS